VGFKQMLRRRQINANSGGRSLRFLLGLADIVRWPFERAAWSVERGLLWPLREWFAGWSPSGHNAGAAALAAIAIAAVLGGVLFLPGGDPPRKQVAAPTRVAIATPDPQPQSDRSQGPVLKGAAPNFAVGAGVGVSRASAAAGAELNAGSADEAPVASDEAVRSEDEAAATTSSKKSVPAGPAAMKVARRFSEAFVFYEIGERPARAKTVFGETATPELATALGERPPRLPADAEVPKARVLNLVPGPRAGKAYTVSVSLLRIGLTSELRLELNKKNGSWLVTDVRG
jgi:hypothetical protein